jgi:hypothetical protein
MAAFSTIATIPGTPPENVFVQIIIEEIRVGLTVKQKIHKDTLLTLLQVTLTFEKIWILITTFFAA